MLLLIKQKLILVSVPSTGKIQSHQFTLNGKPVFINGIAEYEHLLGQSHAFSNEQIVARMKWIQSAGFNAFQRWPSAT